MLVGTNLGIVKGRRKTPIDNEYVMQFREGEKIKCEVVGKTYKEEESVLVEDV
jgi:hypothetical protein